MEKSNKHFHTKKRNKISLTKKSFDRKNLTTLKNSISQKTAIDKSITQKKCPAIKKNSIEKFQQTK